MLDLVEEQASVANTRKRLGTQERYSISKGRSRQVEKKEEKKKKKEKVQYIILTRGFV
jgi:hypothetical protein